MTTTTFVSPSKAIQGAIDRAYSISILYRSPIRTPKATPGIPVQAIPANYAIHEVFMPQMGSHKRDLRIVKAKERRPGRTSHAPYHAGVRRHREGY